jgi:subtilisin family serine protease
MTSALRLLETNMKRLGAVAAVAACASVACGPGGGLASELEAGPQTLALRGIESTFLEIRANGAWTAVAEPGWLAIEPTEGVGNATLTVTVDRTGLEVDTYAGAIVVSGDRETTVIVPVLMRFPEFDGRVHSPGGNLLARERGPREPAALQPGVDFVPGEILVGLDKQLVAIEEHGLFGAVDPALEPSAAALHAAAQTLGARVGARRTEIISPALGLATITIDTPEVASAIAELRRDGRTRYAEPNHLMELHAANDTHYGLQWHYQNLKLEQAWEISDGYEETLVAVIDADFHPDHPDLADNLLPGFDFVRNTNDLLIFNQRCGAHGTHVAGTIAAVTHNGAGVAGAAPRVRVLPLNIAPVPDDPDAPPDEVSCGLPLTASVRAIMYAAGASDPFAGRLDRPVDVINMSFGGPSPSDARAEALAFARDAGVVLISSAGNGGRDEDPISYPAANEIVYAIAATGPDDTRAPYSSFGPEVWVAAPGGNAGLTIPDTEYTARVLSTDFDYPQRNQELVEVIDSAGHAYGLKQGTSMASPHAAAVAALIRSVNPTLPPDDVAEILALTATDLGPPGRDEEYGYGLINAEAAVTVARDNFRVRQDELIVRVVQGGVAILEAEVSAGGVFELGPLAAGEYLLQAGSLRDGQLDVPGTVYGEMTFTVEYTGNDSLRIPVNAR